MKSFYLYKLAYSVLCKSHLPCGCLLCLVLLLSGKTFWSCVTYFPRMSIFCVCCCCRLIWKGFFFLAEESDHSHEAVCTLRVQTSSMLSYFIISPLSLFPYCQHEGFFYETLLTKPCLIAAVQAVKPRCTHDFNTQHEHHVSQGSAAVFCLIPCHYFLVQNDQWVNELCMSHSALWRKQEQCVFSSTALSLCRHFWWNTPNTCQMIYLPFQALKTSQKNVHKSSWKLLGSWSSFSGHFSQAVQLPGLLLLFPQQCPG